MDVEEIRGRIRGSLLAGAAGDALGAPIEFTNLARIRQEHGPQGLRGYAPAYGRAGGAITDDTQMTLFTAEGLLRAHIRGTAKGICHPPSVVHRAYCRWLTTQGEPWPREVPESDGGWLIDVRGLHALRAPGTSCLSALRSGRMGTVDEPVNDSKGCGGVMRVAPVGLVEAHQPFDLAAACAAVTHGHPSGFLSAGVLGAAVAGLLRGDTLEVALDRATADLRSHRGHEETLRSLESARELAARGRPTPEQLESLGGGWVGEEALAIGVCCALVAQDLEDGLLLAVNHSGDSDSTGSIAGNLLGALHGETAIPERLLRDLELRDVVTVVADDLTDAFHGEGVGNFYTGDERSQRWWSRYPGF